MGISVGDVLLTLGLDTGDFNSDLSKTDDEVKQHSDKMSASFKGLQDTLKIVGAAMTAVGAAGLVMVESSLKVNAGIAQTAITLGLTTSELREMVLQTTNVTFPLKSVADTFDYLSKAGVRDVDQLKANANAFDALADATGSSAEAMAGILVPAFKVFGLELPKTSAEMDKFTWLSKNTTISIEEFGSVMDYVAMYGQDLNVTIEDMVSIMAALEAKGMSGATATRLFRTAVNQAKDGTVSLAEALNLTQDEIDKYKDEVANATGITDKFADAGNTQFGVMDKLKQLWSELTLRMGSILAPLEPVLAGMTALGPVFLFLSTKMGENALQWIKQIALHPIATAQLIAHKIALAAHAVATGVVTAAQWALNAAMNANPIGIVVLALGALTAGGIAVWKNWDKITGFFMDAWQNIRIAFGEGVKFIINTVLSPFTDIWVGMVSKIVASAGKLVGIFNKDLGDSIDKVSRDLKASKASLNNWADGLIDSTEAEKELTQISRASGKMTDEQIKQQEKLTEAMRAEENKRYQNALNAIEKRRKDANKEYEKALERIEQEYGAFAEATVNKQTIAEDEHEDALEKLEELNEMERKRAEDKIESLKKISETQIKAANDKYKAESDNLEKLKNEESRYHDKRIKQLNDEAKLAKSNAQSESNAIIDAYRQEMSAAQTTHDARMSQYQDEYNLRLQTIDAELSVAVKALQDQIDIIDQQSEAEERAAMLKSEADEIAAAEATLLAAETADEKLRVQQELDGLLSAQQKRMLEETRAAQKAALEQEIADLIEAADIKKQQLADELEANQSAEDEKLNKVIESLELKITAQEDALQKNLDLINIETQALIDAENTRSDEVLNSIDKRQDALSRAHENNLNNIREELEADIEAEEDKLEEALDDIEDREDREKERYENQLDRIREEKEAMISAEEEKLAKFEEIIAQMEEDAANCDLDMESTITITTIEKTRKEKSSGGGSGEADTGLIPGGKEVVDGPSWDDFGKFMAEGGSGVVSKPTLFLAGEAGPELYNFTPLKNLESGFNQTTHSIQIILNNPIVKENVDIDALGNRLVGVIRAKTGLRI